jgi:hypothetical protein
VKNAFSRSWACHGDHRSTAYAESGLMTALDSFGSGSSGSMILIKASMLL